MEKKNEEKVPAITVLVPKENRLIAINNLSAAILELAKAMNIAPSVNIINCAISTKGTGISIDNLKDNDTEVEKII